MATDIFESYSDFLQRPNKLVNGVSAHFAKDHESYDYDNDTNTGCWNCIGCTDCHFCTSCKDCAGLTHSIACSNTKDNWRQRELEQVIEVFEKRRKRGELIQKLGVLVGAALFAGFVMAIPTLITAYVKLQLWMAGLLGLTP